MFKYILFATWVLLVGIALIYTPPNIALESDALGYYQDAQSAISSNTVFKTWFTPSSYFGDYGYTFILALVMMITGTPHVLIFQILNYVFWALAGYFIYRSLKLLDAPIWTLYLTFFSPVFLTFSGKLYSESYAALGLSILLYCFVANRFTWLYLLGGFILLSAKSSFLPILLIPLIFGRIHKNYRLILLTLAIPILTLSNFLGSANQERRNLVLAIQTAKLTWSYDTIGACTLYYISYPLGHFLVPGYQGACHPNDPTPDMPMVEQNPYGLGAQIIAAGDYHFIGAVLGQPLKHLVLMVSNLGTILWFEGIYPSILLQLPTYLWPPLYLLCKIFLSLYLWYRILRYAVKLGKLSRWGAVLYLSPLIFFALVYGNFHEEQRYFYPLIPYMYLAFGITWVKPQSLLTKFGKVYIDPAQRSARYFAK